MRRRHSPVRIDARSRKRVLLGSPLNAVKCQQISMRRCSSQVLTRSQGIDLLCGSTTANAIVSY